MAYHTHKLVDTTLEEDIYELLFLDSLFISNNTGCFSLDIDEISFLLDPKIVEADHKLGLQAESSTNIRTNLNKDNSDWKYKPVEGIKLVHYHDMIYVPKTLRKHVLKWYHFYLQQTWSSLICTLWSHSLVCFEKYLFIVGIGLILNKEIGFIFQSDFSDRTCVYS